MPQTENKPIQPEKPLNQADDTAEAGLSPSEVLALQKQIIQEIDAILEKADEVSRMCSGILAD